LAAPQPSRRRVRLAGIPVSPLLVGELALLLQEDGWLALSTKLSRAIVERTVAIPLTTRERLAIIEALSDCPDGLIGLRDALRDGTGLPTSPPPA
jgi:hypothetical protein